MRAWQVTRFGAPSEALDLADVPDPELQPGEVLVRATASVLNYNEVDGCRGRYLTINPPLPYTLGMECVGEVVAASTGCEGWLGKRVTASGRGATGSHAELVACPTSMVFEAPEQLSDVEAAAFFYPFHLAHLGLFERGRLAAGETVLVQAGCWATYLIDPRNATLTQRLMASRGGAAVVIGPSSLVGSDTMGQLDEYLLTRLVPGATVGTALLQAKTQMAAYFPGATDVYLGVNYLGDPAVRVP